MNNQSFDSSGPGRQDKLLLCISPFFLFMFILLEQQLSRKFRKITLYQLDNYQLYYMKLHKL